MYTFLLWFKSGREAIARDELAPHRRLALSEARNQRERDIVNRCFDKGERTVVHNIHPLCLLGLRRKIN
jgi:hypothetical protein